MYSCKVCKGTAQRAIPLTPTSMTSPRDEDATTPDAKAISWISTGSAETSFEDEDSRSSLGLGRGKPMSALHGGFPGKRKRMGIMGRPRGGGNSSAAGWKPDYSATSTPTSSTSTSVSVFDKKRVSEVRRRGRQPKIRGMVGLQV
jgi:hypothetical protein